MFVDDIMMDPPFKFQMEEEEHTDREQQRAMFFRKLDKLKKNLNEGEYDCGPTALLGSFLRTQKENNM